MPMKQRLISAGLILNSALILINRYLVSISDWIYLPCLLLGILLIIIGSVKEK